MLRAFNCFCVWVGGSALWFIILIICMTLTPGDAHWDWNAAVPRLCEGEAVAEGCCGQGERRSAVLQRVLFIQTTVMSEHLTHFSFLLARGSLKLHFPALSRGSKQLKPGRNPPQTRALKQAALPAAMGPGRVTGTSLPSIKYNAIK